VFFNLDGEIRDFPRKGKLMHSCPPSLDLKGYSRE
jgi:hypothetical protein